MSEQETDLKVLASQLHIDQRIIEILPKRRLCKLVNEIAPEKKFDCSRFDTNDDPSIVAKKKKIEKEDETVFEDRLWRILKKKDQNNGTVLVEWAPSCVSTKDFETYKQKYEIKKIDRNVSLVKWKDSDFATDQKIGRIVKNIISEKNGSIIVAWEPSCIGKDQKEAMKEKIDEILIEDAVRIEWKDSLIPIEEIIEEILEENALQSDVQKRSIKKNNFLRLSLKNERNYDEKLKNLKPVFIDRDFNLNAKKLSDLGKKYQASNCFKNTQWIIDSLLKKDVEKLICIDNMGSGDCLYCALAPMFREFFPNLFLEEFDNTEENNAIQLRKILATKIPTTYDGVKSFLKAYIDSLDPLNQFDKKNIAKIEQKYANFLTSDRDEILLQETIKQLREEMMTQNYWAHRVDLVNASELVAPFVHIIVLESEYGKKVPNSNYDEKFPAFNIIYDTKYDILPETKFIFIYHQKKHFLRLQKEDNFQFAFSKKEFEKNFPQIAKLYFEQVNTTPLNINLLRLFEFIIENKKDIEKEIKQKKSYNDFYIRFLGFDNKNLEENVAEEFPAVRIFTQLDKQQKLQLMDEILSKRKKKVPTVLNFSNSDTTEDNNKYSLSPEVEKARKQLEEKKSKQDQLSEQLKEEDLNLSQEDFYSWTNLNTTVPSITISDTTPEKSPNFEAKKKNVDNFVKEFFKTEKSNLFEQITFPCISINDIEQEIYEKTLEKAKLNLDQDFNLIDNVHSIKGQTILLLQDKNWLNDEIINAYLKIIVRRHNVSHRKNYEAISSLLYNEKKDSKEQKKLNIKQNAEKVFWPINAHGNHWFLSVIDFLEKKIFFYDSLCSTSDEKTRYVENIKFLIPEAKSFIVENVATPQQQNIDDCGVYTLAFAMQLLNPSFKKFTISPTDISCLRKRILFQLLQFQ